MKLELKHIAPYLPYKLRVEGEIMIGELIPDGISRGYSQSQYSVFYVLENQLKPILRPLSDLTKEIEHNGERFVPIKTGNFGCHYKEMKLGIHNLAFEAMVNLFEWHFDVFGLIEKGLAIDMNTLKEKV